jgi:hypothetical protein
LRKEAIACEKGGHRPWLKTIGRSEVNWAAQLLAKAMMFRRVENEELQARLDWG